MRGHTCGTSLLQGILHVLVYLGLFSVSALAGEHDRRLDIYWIDVEGGAATLLVTPRGESVLIDTGNPGTRDPQRIFKVVTEVARLRSIDVLIVTHYHRDHFGGAEMLSTLLPIGEMYDNGKFEGMPDNPGEAYFQLKTSGRHVITPGMAIPLKQTEQAPLRFTCLAARQQFVDPALVQAPANEAILDQHKAKERDGSDNANSVVMLLQFGNFRFYDGGDLTWNQEFRLVYPHNLIGEVDLYQVTHHGLDSSNNPALLLSCRPTVALVNNGDQKGCFPEVIENLRKVKELEAIYQMHKNLRSDGAGFNAADDMIANQDVEAKCAGEYIKLSVAPDSSSYVVEIPARGHRREFRTRQSRPRTSP